MNQLSVRFFLTNIFTSVWLILNATQANDDNAEIWHGQNIVYGIFIYLVFIAGIFFCFVKARDLAYRQVHNLSRFERFLQGMFYIFALGAHSLLLFSASSLMFGGHENVPDWFETTSIVVMLIAFGFLVAEGSTLAGGTSKIVHPRTLKIANYVIPLYIGVGISVVWNTMIVGGNVSLSLDQADILSETIASIVLVIMLVLPFQRLLWYEVFMESLGWRANLQVIGGLAIVVAGAVVPLFFKG